MNFCNVSPLNCLKITNFYCTRVKLLQFDDYLRIKVSIFLKKFPPCSFIRACLIIDTSWIFLPACLLQPARLFKFHGISSLLVYQSLLDYQRHQSRFLQNLKLQRIGSKNLNFLFQALTFYRLPYFSNIILIALHHVI